DAHVLDAIRAALYGSMLFGDADFNYVLWTISVVFYGSLLVFACYALLRRHVVNPVRCKLMAGLDLLLLSRLWNFYGLFLLGAALAYVDWSFVPFWSARRTLWTSIILLLAGVYASGYHPDSLSYAWSNVMTATVVSWWPLFDATVVYPASGALAVMSAVLMLSLRFASSSRTLAWQGLGWLGGLSFSVYLLHPLVLASVG